MLRAGILMSADSLLPGGRIAQTPNSECGGWSVGSKFTEPYWGVHLLQN